MGYIKGLVVDWLSPYYRRIQGGEIIYIVSTIEKSMKRLAKKWSDEEYLKLEDCRRLAEERGMWFTELRVLLKEAQSLLEYLEEGGEERFAAVMRRVVELTERFSVSDEEFIENYSPNRDMLRVLGEKVVENVLVDTYDELSRGADVMACNLQYKIAVMLWSAMKKLMLKVDIPVDDRVKGAMQMAVYNGAIQRTEETIECYDEALKMAREEGNEMLEYCVLMRKISWCMGHAHVNETLRIDDVRMDAMKMLIEMCEKRGATPKGVGEMLIAEADREMEENGGKDKKWIERRKAQVREAMQIMNLLLSCARGDSATVGKVESRIEKAEKELYGGDAESAVGGINMAYQMAYNSEDRAEMEENVKVVPDKENDNIYIPEKPKNILKKDWLYRLQVMATNEMYLGHKNAAEMLYLLSQIETNSSYSDYQTAMSICMMGRCVATLGDEELALTNYKLAAMVLEEKESRESDNDLSPYIHYMMPYHHALLLIKKDVKEAIRLMTKAIDNIMYKERMVLMTTLFRMHRAEMYAKSGEREKAERDVRESLVMIKKEVEERLPVADIDLKERIWMTVSRQIEMAVGVTDAESSAEMRREVYEAVLYAKGFLLSSENSVRRVVYEEEGMEQERALYEETETIRKSLAPWGTSTDGDEEKYVQLYMKEMKLLCQTEGVVSRYYDFVDERYETIREALGEGERVMDCFDYEKDGERKYVAFVFGREDEAPRMVGLELARIEEQIESERGGVVWFVPSGELHKIPVESKRVHGIRRLSHARNIMKMGGGELESIALFGGLDYGGEVRDSDDVRGFLCEINEARVTPLLPWPELRNTGKEVDSIEFMWKMCKNERVEVYRKREGSADRFMSLGGKGVSVIHLATHGFFETKETKGELPVLRGTVRPMDMTGVVMSNGNRGWLHGDRMQHEGILLASDIAKMDLRGVEMVVMSACHSGNGTVKADGVYGLQRALKKAGAKSLIMSLWNEGDEEGCEFMKEFYSRLIGEGMERHQAFEEAKEEMKKCGVEEKYWAGFIMID